MVETIGIASCVSAPGPEDRSFQIIPSGEFRAIDGRPKDVACWRLNKANALSIIQKVRTRSKPLLIDYEHQTLNTTMNGKPAPAAGWIGDLEWKDGMGIFAIGTDWTEKAQAFLRAKEYRYISPVFTYNKNTGDILDILHIALTNNPALPQLPEVTLQAAAKSLPVPIVSYQYEDVILSDEEITICRLLNLPITDYIRTKHQDHVEALSTQELINSGISSQELAICRQMDIDPKDYLATKNQVN